MSDFIAAMGPVFLIWSIPLLPAFYALILEAIPGS